MIIAIIEDDSAVRYWAEGVLKPLTERVSPSRIIPIESGYGEDDVLSGVCMALYQRIPQNDVYRSRSYFDAIVLDLHLGDDMYDGLRVARSLRHSLDTTFVVHSSSWNYAKVKQQAPGLGIRFGVTKYSQTLPEAVKAAMAVTRIKSMTSGWAMEWLNRPILPSPAADLHVELLQRTLAFGLKFDGTWESVKSLGGIQEAENLKAMSLECFRVEGEEYAKAKSWDRAYYENSYNGSPGLWDLPRYVNETVEAVQPHLVY